MYERNSFCFLCQGKKAPQKLNSAALKIEDGSNNEWMNGYKWIDGTFMLLLLFDDLF